MYIKPGGLIMQFSKQITRLAIVCSLMIALTVINIDFLRAVNQLENPLQWPEIKSEHKPEIGRAHV